METITAIEAVRKAIDPWGMEGQHTTAMRPTASEVVERLRTLGFAVARIDLLVSRDIFPIYRDQATDPVSESEQRVLDGNR
jgi:hypothetical protein